MPRLYISTLETGHFFSLRRRGPLSCRYPYLDSKSAESRRKNIPSEFVVPDNVVIYPELICLPILWSLVVAPS